MKENFKNCTSEQTCKDSAAQEICSSLIAIRSPLQVMSESLAAASTQKANLDVFTQKAVSALEAKDQQAPKNSNYPTKRLLFGGPFNGNSGYSFTTDFTVVANKYISSYGNHAPMIFDLCFL